MAHVQDVAPLDPLPGNPHALEIAGRHYAGVADAIAYVSAELRLIAQGDVSIGDAADAIRAQTEDAAAQIAGPLPRYRETAQAMREYAVALADAQSDAQDAVAAVDAERTTLWQLIAARDALDDDILRTSALGDPRGELDELRRERDRIAWRIGQHESDLDDALASYRAAEAAVETAAQLAIARIRPVLDLSNDRFADHLGAMFDAATGFFAAIGEWIEGVLEQVVQVLAALVAAVLTLTLFSVMTLLLAPLLLTGRISPDQLLDLVIGTALVVLPLLDGWLALWLGIELAKPTPPMTFTQARPQSRTGDPYQDAFADAHAVDVAGGADKTVVEIVRVGTDADGQPIWRVILPSTQDWEVPADTGAANDLGSNLALMIAAGGQAAYERMVVEAMAQAGIDGDDHVMLVGFSQGGILAGKMASDPDCPYNVEAIVTAGSPIDHMAIPPSVSVMSFQHVGDPVPRLDGQAAAPPRANWATIAVDPGASAANAPIRRPPVYVDFSAHDAMKYSSTAEQLANGGLATGGHIDPATAAAADAVREDQARFFSDLEVAYRYEGHE